MPRILRVKPFGTQYGGSGQIKAVPGITTPARSGNTTMQQMALAANRVKAWRKMGGTIGSRGKL